ncbi:hypothetical protein AYO39_02035 [Actinobacteria bacterium SCGC AG-212-D09]|nr:hypothetical protein AYO39_02035 [Actinobacteria bacterium SCGC AG-212-D09]
MRANGQQDPATGRGDASRLRVVRAAVPEAPECLRRVPEDEVDPDARYLNRLFGGRGLLVAGLTVAAVRAGDERHAFNINLICEGTDTVSLLEELRVRGAVDRAVAIGIAFNVAGYATLLRALRALRG